MKEIFGPQVSIENARPRLGEIVDQARLGGWHTTITRQGKPAAVVVDSEWYASVFALIEELEALEAYRDRVAALRAGRRVAGLTPLDRRVVHHIDGDPHNNDLSNLQITEPRENTRRQP